MTELYLRQVLTPEDRATARTIVETYHSYVPIYEMVGRRIDWIVMRKNLAIGVVGIASCVLFFPKPMIEFFGIQKYDGFSRRWLHLNKIAVNWRFTLTDKAKPNDGSRVLSLLVRLAPKMWKAKYGDDLCLLYTLVGAEKPGTVYKAGNWTCIGKTRGSKLKKRMAYGSAKHDQNEGNWSTKAQTKAEQKLIYVWPYDGWQQAILKKR